MCLRGKAPLIELGARSQIGRATLGAGYTHLRATFQSAEREPIARMWLALAAVKTPAFHVTI